MSQTLGCVMLNNRHIDRIFEAVEVGTPVTIVGALEAKNSVSMALAALDGGEDDDESAAEVESVEPGLSEEG
jgi:hypothetical protein